MRKYAYIMFFNGEAVGAGTLAADKETSAEARLRKMYGSKKQGFSWVIHKMV